MKKNNIVLIGMPSSGKSTIGAMLSKEMNMDFIDTDAVIKEKEKRELRDIVNTDGLQAFLDIQDAAILSLDLKNHVIATGGGVVHGQAAMNYLKEIGVVIYLELKCEEIEQRITEERRFARNRGQTFRELYNERVPLYMKYADFAVNCSGKTEQDITTEIKAIISI